MTDLRQVCPRLIKAAVLALVAPFILAAGVAVATAGSGALGPAAAAGTPGVTATGTVMRPSWYSIPSGSPRPVQAAIAYTLAQLGKPYLWGGSGPAGYDCSGLVMMAYRAAGVTIPRTTYQQVEAGTAIRSFGDLHPGDLLFKAGSDGTPAHPGHVGMYIGGGLVVQAPHTGTDINLTPASQWQASTVAIQRIIG